MKRLVHLFFFTIVFINSTSAQLIELHGGLNAPYFYGAQSNEPHTTRDYTNPKMGYRFGLAVGPFKGFNVRFTLQYCQYEGEVYSNTGGLGGATVINAHINKSVLNLGVDLLNFKIGKRTEFKAGFFLGGLISGSYSGTYYKWQLYQPAVNMTLQEKHPNYLHKMNGGFQFNLTWNLKLAENLFLRPQIHYYLGITSELENEPTMMRSMHGYCGIGIQRKFSFKKK
ncbi:MAG: hypothetical protein ACK476_04940 [Fluviicola sp.]